MMKKILVMLFWVAVCVPSLRAQDYNWGVGLRGGAEASGISVKAFVSGADAIEAMVSFVDGVNVYALYERNLPVIGNGFNFFYGAGANAGSWKKHGHAKYTMGIDAIVGLEYKIENVPLTLGVDYKPCLNFVGQTGFKWYDIGFTVRVAF